MNEDKLRRMADDEDESCVSVGGSLMDEMASLREEVINCENSWARVTDALSLPPDASTAKVVEEIRALQKIKHKYLNPEVDIREDC